MSNDIKPSVNGKHDLLTHRIVVISLGAFILFTGLNVTVLTLMGKEVPQACPRWATWRWARSARCSPTS